MASPSLERTAQAGMSELAIADAIRRDTSIWWKGIDKIVCGYPGMQRILDALGEFGPFARLDPSMTAFHLVRLRSVSLYVLGKYVDPLGVAIFVQRMVLHNPFIEAVSVRVEKYNKHTPPHWVDVILTPATVKKLQATRKSRIMRQLPVALTGAEDKLWRSAFAQSDDLDVKRWLVRKNPMAFAPGTSGNPPPKEFTYKLVDGVWIKSPKIGGASETPFHVEI